MYNPKLNNTIKLLYFSLILIYTYQNLSLADV
jgi:hypothetical protein